MPLGPREVEPIAPTRGRDPVLANRTRERRLVTSNRQTCASSTDSRGRRPRARRATSRAVPLPDVLNLEAPSSRAASRSGVHELRRKTVSNADERRSSSSRPAMSMSVRTGVVIGMSAEHGAIGTIERVAAVHDHLRRIGRFARHGTQSSTLRAAHAVDAPEHAAVPCDTSAPSPRPEHGSHAPPVDHARSAAIRYTAGKHALPSPLAHVGVDRRDEHPSVDACSR